MLEEKKTIFNCKVRQSGLKCTTTPSYDILQVCYQRIYMIVQA